MAQADNYGYKSGYAKSSGGYKSANDEGYNWRLEEARKRAAAAAAAARMARNQTYNQYRSQQDMRREDTGNRLGDYRQNNIGNTDSYYENLQKQKEKENSTWYKLTQQSAKDVTGGFIKNFGNKMIGVAGQMDKAQEEAQNNYRKYYGTNPAPNWSASALTPMGTPMTTQTGGVYGGYGAGLSAGDYRTMMNEYKNRYGGLVPPDPSLYRTGTPSTTATGIAEPFTRPPEWAGTMVTDAGYNEYLDALRYGTRGGGMASQGYTGVDTYVPPEELPLGGGGGDNSGGGGGYYDPYGYTWGDMNLRGGGGYGGGGYGYGGYGGNNYKINYNNNYRSGGGTGTRSNDIASWYANMVNWNVNRPKGG